MTEIGIGIVGGGYMGKAHSSAFASVGTVFETTLKPRLEAICASTLESGARYARAYGYNRAATDWRDLVNDPKVEAVVIASPQSTHREVAVAACAAVIPGLCEIPLGLGGADARAMVAAADAGGVINQVAYNYSRTPATQYARQLIADGRIGRVTYARIELTEDFQNDPGGVAAWRCSGEANGCLGDLAPHPINAALALCGPVAELNAVMETVLPERGGVAVTNDDQVQMMLRFASGATGHLYASRTATGRKMGYNYEVFGTEGALRFDGEDQNVLWLYEADTREAERGFKRILTGPAHPDYKAFCLGPGHGTGYQDQIIIEAKDFLIAIESGQPRWPTFADGLAVQEIMAATRASHAARSWVSIADYQV